MVDNKDKNPTIDETILDETPPNINEPQVKEGDEPKDPEEKKEQWMKREFPLPTL